MAKYRVLREGLSHREGSGWVRPKVGGIVELPSLVATQLLAEEPPYIEPLSAVSGFSLSRGADRWKKKGSEETPSPAPVKQPPEEVSSPVGKKGEEEKS